MRRKLYLGLLLAALVSVAAGDYAFSRFASAQDTPKKTEPEAKKSDWFDKLKKELEAKKETAPPVAGLPAPPSLTVPQDIAPPSLPTKPDALSFPPIAPPTTQEKPTIAPPSDKKSTGQSIQFPSPPVQTPIVSEPKKSLDITPPKAPVVDGPLVQVDAPKPSPKKDAAPPITNNTLPVAPTNPEPSIGSIPPPLGAQNPVQRQVNPPIKGVSSPWTLHVEMHDGQTTVTATVNKKHEFKIVCQSLDLQTGKGMMKATGKVTISGDMLDGKCDHLAIVLSEDRLILEGGALVSIEKSSSVSDARSSAFEMKGEKLDLRISELQSGRLLRTGWNATTIPSATKNTSNPATRTSRSSANWTDYGVLRSIKMKRNSAHESAMWQLEDRTGKVIATLVARDGGTLAQYEGQRISVLGAREQLDGQSVLRVTHIALP